MSLESKAKTTRQVAALIENKYDEDEMGREYICRTNYHDEWKWVRLEDALLLEGKIVALETGQFALLTKIKELEARLNQARQYEQNFPWTTIKHHQDPAYRVALAQRWLEQLDKILEGKEEVEKK
jgi:hypothetical protein